MKWNWQRPDWPRFTWKSERIAKAEEQFLLGGGVLVGTVRHLGTEDHDRLTVDAISTEALTTSAIEGEILDRDSVQSSIRRQLHLGDDRRRIRPAEHGIAEMMVDLYRHYAIPLSDALLFAWHRMLFTGRRDLRDVGRYRTHLEPMQVVSGRVYEPTVHFEAPPSGAVPGEMARFIDWFNLTGPAGGAPLPALTRAGIAHLWFESIHPFEDGNGRLGRAISERALAQSLGRPSLSALAATILARRRAYYGALERANKDNEITAWLAWFAGIGIEAQRRTLAQVEFIVETTRLLDGLRGRLNDRQERAIRRMLREGPEGFEGGLSAGKYVTIARTSSATATRDLAELVALGALRRAGERRHARYHLAIPLRPTPAVTIDEDGNIVG